MWTCAQVSFSRVPIILTPYLTKHSRAIWIVILHEKELVTQCLYNIASYSFCPWWLEGTQQAVTGKGSFILCQCHKTPAGDGQVLPYLGWLPWPSLGISVWLERLALTSGTFSVCYMLLCNSDNSYILEKNWGQKDLENVERVKHCVRKTDNYFKSRRKMYCTPALARFSGLQEKPTNLQAEKVT